ncbi:MAG: tRNA (5-methylaminomethyl-2-thiouridine)(34)-methyltransferase MnmD, partial [Betaproteobacteria bacterium]|nr:tRNA (5-methylaminomethyl-2-thiouridine)(34)-methyltransferase MnmD [Betaproteobacteria bacterium]
MHTPLTPADVEIDEHGLPFSPTYGDVYHPQAGAIAQAQHVFLAGNELPRRWQGRTRYTLVETGFGLGHNFLATWQAWRSDPQRPARLHYVSIDKHPVRTDTLRALLSRSATGALEALAQQLLAQWPPLVSGMHRLVFEHGQVELLLCLGDVASALRQLTLDADAFYLDGFAPARNPAMWHSALYPQLARLARTGATLATWSASHRVRADLAACGFTVQAQPGFGGKREMTVAHFSPRHTPRFSAPWARGDDTVQHRHALVVGAGLAGCATVAALAAQGWHSTLIDAHAHIAAGASGNARGVFHGVVHAADNPHARLGRAAALELERALAGLAAHTAALQWSRGLLRLAP